MERTQREWLIVIVSAVCVAAATAVPSSRGLAHGPTAEDGVEAAGQSPPRAALPRCPGELRLVASVVNEKRPRLSLAVVRNVAGPRVLSIGNRFENLTLEALAADHARLRTPSGTLCALSVFSGRRSAEVALPKPAKSNVVRTAQLARAEPTEQVSAKADDQPKPRAVLSREELADGVRALGADSYAVSRDLLLKALKNPGGAAAGAWFKHVERNGKAGMEVRAVRPGTALHQMGIQNGDVVRSVNGIDLNSPTGLLEALRVARESGSISLSVVREGRERAMRYLVE